MAIIGIGTDILEIERISNILSRGDAFLERVFTQKERQYFEEKGSVTQSAAAFWCAKEAVSKALGTGFRGFGLKDIEVSHNDLGKPVVLLHGNARLLGEVLGIANIQLSLSHSDIYAIAFCVVE